MSAKKNTEVSKFMHLLNEWDKGVSNIRRKILIEFVNENSNCTGTEIEEKYAYSASLLLTRITAWLRLTYVFVVYADCSNFLD
jgi:hypothetical protein